MVRLHQRCDDLTLFVGEPRSPRLPLRFALGLLVLSPLNEVLLPLHFLVCQDDCVVGGGRGWQRNSRSFICIYIIFPPRTPANSYSLIYSYRKVLIASFTSCVLHCSDSYVNRAVGGGVVVLRRKRMGGETRPHGDPRCTEQLRTLSLFLWAPCCSSH